MSSGLGLGRLGANIGRTFARQLISIVLGLGLVVLLARILGPAGNGAYALAVLLPTLASTFLNLGIGPANVYFVSRGTVTVRQALKTSVQLWLLLSLLGMIVTIPLLCLKAEVLFPGIPLLFLWLSLVVFPVALLQSFLSSLLQGLQDFRRFNKVLLIAPAATLLFSAILVWAFDFGVPGALVSFGMGQALGLLVSIYALRPHLGDDQKEPTVDYAKSCLNYGWKAHLSNILTFINYRVDIYLVNLFLNPAAAGIYVIAVQVGERLWLLSQAVSTVILPRLSELHRDEDSRRRLTPIISRWVFLLTAVAAGLLVLSVKPLIRLLFGIQYLDAVDALLWLLPGIVLWSLSRVLANDLAARGRPELNLYTSILVVVANIMGNILLIPRLGIVGAAIATSLAYLMHFITTLIIYSALSKNVWWAPILISGADWGLVKKATCKGLKHYK